MSTRAPFHERLSASLFEPVDASSLVFFRVDGDSVEMEVLNPTTLEEIQRASLR